MKTRILSLLLAVLMLVLCVPFFAIGTMADEENSGTPEELSEEEAYEIYKELYYDDGHLIAFLNTHNIKADETVYHSDGEVKVTAGDARLVLGDEAKYTPEERAAMTDEQKKELVMTNRDAGYGLRAYVKIIGGKNAGKYYALTTDGVGANQMQVNDPDYMQYYISLGDDGFINFHEDVSGKAGIYLANVYDKSLLTEKSTIVYNTTAEKDTYFRPQDLASDGFYGTYTVEQVVQRFYEAYKAKVDYVAEANPTQYWNRNTITIIDGGGSCAGFITYKDFGDTWVGAQGRLRTGLDIPFYTTVHFTLQMNYDTPTTWYSDTRMITNGSDKQKYGLIKTNSGSIYRWDANSPNLIYYVKEWEQRAIKTSTYGRKMYYSRIYDCSLTDEQMLRNHFADLCYYYRLKNTDKLLEFGSYALNYDFYKQFENYDVAKCTDTMLAELQAKIDRVVNSTPKVADVVDCMNKLYNQAKAYYDETVAAMQNLESVIETIDKAMLDASSVTSDNAEALELLKQAIVDLKVMADAASASKHEIEAIKSIVDANYNGIKEAVDAVNNAAEATLELAKNANKVIYDDYGVLIDAADEVKFSVSRAMEVAKSADEVAKYAASAVANASTNAENYIKFAGYQARVADYAGIRAVFTVDKEKLAQGFTYLKGTAGEKKYNVVSAGIIGAYAVDDISDIKVDYKNGVCTSSAEGARIQFFEDRYELDADDTETALERTLMSGKAYGFETSFIMSPYGTKAADYQRKYMYRAFIVFEGEGTQYIRYVNADGISGASSVSAYDVCAKIAASDTTNPAVLNPKFFITKVIMTVTKGE